jgi:hypothetical protein
VVNVDPHKVPDVALGTTVLVVIDACLIFDMVVVGEVNILGTEFVQVPIGSEWTTPCADQRVIVNLYEPERRLCDSSNFVGSGTVIFPRGAHANARSKEPWIVGEKAAGHEAAIREPSHINAVGIDRIGKSCHDLVDELLDSGTVDGLVVVGNSTRARVHPEGGTARRKYVGSATELRLDVCLAEGNDLIAGNGTVWFAATFTGAMEPQDEGYLAKCRLWGAENRVSAMCVDCGEIRRKERIAHLKTVKRANSAEIPAIELRAEVFCALIPN